MDLSLFTIINGVSGRLPLLDAAGIFFAVYAIFLLLALIVWKGWKRHELIMIGLFSMSVSYLSNACLGLIHFRARPFMTHEVHQLISGVWTTKSFPSDHSALAFAMATSLFLFDHKLGIGALVVAFFIAISRVFVGVHYPSDILVGSLIGIFWSIFFYHKMTGYRATLKNKFDSKQ